MLNSLDEIDPHRFYCAIQKSQPYALQTAKVKVNWECNLRCKMCRHWRKTDAAPIPSERMMRLFDELADLGCRKITFSGGEPLLHPDIHNFIRRASSHEIKVAMNTNGTLVGPRRSHSLARAGLSCASISVDGPTAEIHDKIRGTAGAFHASVFGIECLAKVLPRGKVRLHAVVGDANYETMVEMPALAARIGASLRLSPLRGQWGGISAMTPDQVRDYNERIAPIVAERALAEGVPDLSPTYAFQHLEEPAYATLRCFAPFVHTAISHDGSVRICCRTLRRRRLGNLKTHSLREIWEGDAYAKLRHRRKPPLLRHCLHCHDFVEENTQLAKQLQSTRTAEMKTVKGFIKACFFPV